MAAAAATAKSPQKSEEESGGAVQSVKNAFKIELQPSAGDIHSVEMKAEVKAEAEQKTEGAEEPNSGERNSLESADENDALADWRPSAAGSALRPRSFLSDTQVKVLADQFRRNALPNKYEMSGLAERIGVNKRVVQVKICREENGEN